jgi:hypothetical protein
MSEQPIDWLNPSTHMLAGLDAGRNERQSEIDDLEAEIAKLESELAGERAAVDAYYRHSREKLEPEKFQEVFNSAQNAKFDCVGRTDEEKQAALEREAGEQGA